MSEGDDALVEQLALALARLGAAAGQDRVMAAQLLKRARQVAAQTGMGEVEALSQLLAKVVAGRRGEYPGTSGGISD